jgi:hypothetical protein
LFNRLPLPCFCNNGGYRAAMFIAKGQSGTSQVETKNMSDDVKASAQRVRLSRGSSSSTRQLILPILILSSVTFQPR